MEIAELIVELLKYIGPAIVVMLGMKLVLDQNRKQQVDQQAAWLRAEVLKEHLPLRLGAYERAMLFVERIKPDQLLIRELAQAGSIPIHQHLIKQVSEEFEHNIAQQIYISPKAWGAVSAAKDQTIGLLIKTTNELSGESDPEKFKNLLLSNYQELEQNMVQIAGIVLKQDVAQIFSLNPSQE